MTLSVVIVGTGQAGCQLATSLRERRFEGAITLVGSEAGLPYQKPLMSKGFLNGSLEEADLTARPPSFFAQKEIDFRPDTNAAVLDRAGQRLVLESGTAIGFDHLVIASGAENRSLDVPGATLDGVMMLRSRADAIQLKQRLASEQRVVIVGAGFIGLEVAAAASQLGMEVIVIERADRVLARAVSRPVSDYLLGRHVQAGVRILFGAALDAFFGEGGRLSGIRLRDGQVFKTGLALVAVGVIPTVGLAEAAGLPVGNGILVDETLTTADPRVHAIGDCANYPHPLLDGRRVRIESIQNAVDQARCLAMTLTGAPTVFAKVPWFWSDQWDIRLQIAGVGSEDDQAVLRGDPQAGRFSVFRLRQGRLAAVESINQVAEHMAARTLIQQRPMIDPATVLDPRIGVKDLGRDA